ncbi:S26 family signal peptidase [Sphingomonas nostoxanthinifaciens]|uniref:S26 family signal peptidase n=1 Tax=Sphingomonas nostoxanthinifaciens TaxID=2872652 RepID=UPI002955BD99|nr:S26 family signal peptidase [Sphingomonas nostoxanthinifaciens]
MATAAFPPAPRLVWNASASAPIGLYAVDPGARFRPGDMVIAWTPAPFRALAADRRYIPSNVPLVKRVAAGPGDEICALGTQVFVNGRPSAHRRSVDDHGRSMPLWSGCQRLRDGQSLLLNDHPGSFDGRYFGPTNDADVIGKARRLWRW